MTSASLRLPRERVVVQVPPWRAVGRQRRWARSLPTPCSCISSRRLGRRAGTPQARGQFLYPFYGHAVWLEV